MTSVPNTIKFTPYQKAQITKWKKTQYPINRGKKAFYAVYMRNSDGNLTDKTFTQTVTKEQDPHGFYPAPFICWPFFSMMKEAVGHTYGPYVGQHAYTTPTDSPVLKSVANRPPTPRYGNVDDDEISLGSQDSEGLPYYDEDEVDYMSE